MINQFPALLSIIKSLQHMTPRYLTNLYDSAAKFQPFLRNTYRPIAYRS
jgi:hypothetical protein